MNTIEFKEGTRKVIATRNDPTSNWMARLYVNNGETATFRQYSCKTYAKLVIWAQEVLKQ